jgi:hypothetical protein
MTAVSWVSGDAAEAMFAACAEPAGRGLLPLHRDVVRLGVERTYRSMQRQIRRLTRDGALVWRTPPLYSKKYDRGSLTSRIVAPGRAEIELTGLPDVREIDLRGLIYGIETALNVAGRRGVRLHFERRPDGALFVSSRRPEGGWTRPDLQTRSAARTWAKSSGGGRSKRTGASVRGWTKPRTAACSIVRGASSRGPS